jgi:Mor family transcriptional regulator
MKPYLEPDMFDKNLLDRALDIIMAIKNDMEDTKARLTAQETTLKDICTTLQEIADAFIQVGQNDLFPGNGVNVDSFFSELVDIIGKDAANRLVDFYSGSSIYVPKNIIVEQKYQKIREEYKNGLSYRDLAVQYKYTERYVRTIIHRKKRGERI